MALHLRCRLVNERENFHFFKLDLGETEKHTSLHGKTLIFYSTLFEVGDNDVYRYKVEPKISDLILLLTECGMISKKRKIFNIF